jgi:peptidoglycan/xylan/chitin deacetylase (PgdA/CDA1 family)
LSCIILWFSCGSLLIEAVTLKDSATSKEYYFNRNESNKIALTFDDGPHPRQTPIILNILEKYGIKATFFVVGINAKNYPDTLKHVAKKGHEIGNHTFSHKYVKGKDADTISEDLELCNKTIYEICGKTPTLFRAPGGLMDEISVSNEQAFKPYNIIYWSIDTMDWDHHSPESIAEMVLSTVRSGDIILMHDYIGHNSPTAEALELIIPKLLERGYVFVTVSELINENNKSVRTP